MSLGIDALGDKGRRMALRMPLRQSYQDLVRLRHIAQVLIRNGLGFVLDRFGLSRLLAPLGKKREGAQPVERASIPARVRKTLEDLGPTYVKLGQLMSTRPDILPPDFIAELAKLLDSVPPFPAALARRRIEEELGQPIEALYATFDSTPVASASIGQVHYATLHSGERVVVKVQRPNIRRTIGSDLGLLLRQARFLESRSALARNYQLVELIDEFGQALQDELDYMREGRNAERLAQALADDERVAIPKVYWDLTTSQVITLEDVRGPKLTELAELQRQGYDLASISEVIADIYFQQIFRDGVFHADPHPANIILKENKVSLVDFGLVGFISSEMKADLRDLFVAVISQDAPEIAQAVLRLGAVGSSNDERALEKDIRRFLHRYYGATLESVSIGEFLKEIMEIAFAHRIRLPADLALLARTLIVLEGVALNLNPAFNFVEFAKPYLTGMMREQFSPRRWGAESVRALRSLRRLGNSLPRRATTLLDQLEDGEFTLHFELSRLDRVMLKLDSIANRLAFSVIVAALIIGSALIIRAGGDAVVWRIPLVNWNLPVAQITFVFAGIIGAWLLLSIIRAKGLK